MLLAWVSDLVLRVVDLIETSEGTVNCLPHNLISLLNQIISLPDNTCGGFMTSMNGIFETPNFPSLYPRNSNCLWLIKVPKVDQIEVKYSYFELEEDRYCRTDRVVTMAPRIYRPARECGTRVQNKKIASNIMMIEFISNDRVEKRGFKATYMASVIPETTTKATTTTMKPTTTTMPSKSFYYPLFAFLSLTLACASSDKCVVLNGSENRLNVPQLVVS